MVDMFNHPARNARNRKSGPVTNAAPSINEQIVEANKLRDANAAEARGRILGITNPDTIALTAEQQIAQEAKLAKNMKALVDKFSLKIAHDALLNTTMRNLYDAKRMVDNGALFCANHLARLYTTEEILALPMGGETEKDVLNTNRSPDKYSKTYYDRVEATKRTKATSFYRELVEQMEAGDHWITRWNNFKYAQKGKNHEIKGDAKEFRRNNAAQYEQEYGTCSDALSSFTKWMRQGASFLKQLEAMNASKHVVAIIRKDDDGNYMQLKKPVTLRIDPPTDDEYETMTLNSFISINVQVAIENGDNWEAWQAEMSRGAEDDKPDEDNKSAVQSLIDLEKIVIDIDGWLGENHAIYKEHYTALLTAISKKGSEDFRKSLYRVCTLCDDIRPHLAKEAKDEAERIATQAGLKKQD